MTQTALAEFLFTSSTSSIQLQLIEIYHPDFTQTYRIIKNKISTAATVLVAHDDLTAPVDYTYYPVQIKCLGTTNSLDQKLEVTFGDLGQILPAEVARLRTRNGSRIKPTLTYREYDSSILGNTPTEFEWIFNGSSNFVNMGSVATLKPSATTPFSVVVWYKGTDTTGGLFSQQDFPTGGRGWSLYIFDGKLYCGLMSSNSPVSVGLQFVGDDDIDDDVLHCCILTYDGSTNLSGFNGYVDLNLQAKTDNPPGGFNLTDNLTIGDPTGSITAALNIGARNAGEFVSGRISHAAFLNKELDSGERSEVYNGGVPPDLLSTSLAGHLLGWWKMDGVSDVPGTGGITDHGSGGNNGTANFNPTGSDLVPALTGLIYGPFEMEINSISFNKTGAVFTARPTTLNRTRVGEVYDPGRFPMLKGFL
jgi:hypothetical protein